MINIAMLYGGTKELLMIGLLSLGSFLAILFLQEPLLSLHPSTINLRFFTNSTVLLPTEPNDTVGANSQPSSSCQSLSSINNNDSISSEYEFYKAVHESPFPACAAGLWTNQPDLAAFPSQEHLKCLDLERQGNCHDPNVWINATDSAILSRHQSILKGAVSNSPGILNAKDPWVWESDLEPYKAVSYHKNNKDSYRKRIRTLLLDPEPLTIYLIGDSLTRQWCQAIKCEIMHVLGISPEVADRIVKYFKILTGLEEGAKYDGYWNLIKNASARDYVVVNLGHHVGNRLGVDWPPQYAHVLEKAMTWDFGKIPESHMFFRTTSVRHFLAGRGDWDTDSSKAGGIRPNMQDVWSVYGGNKQEQPDQNLLAFDVLLGGDDSAADRTTSGVRRNRFRILDTSPMMLARADTSFDGNHFCLPGPMEFWSRMLYYQMEKTTSR